MKINKNRLILIGLAVVVLLLILVAIRFPFTVTTPCLFAPQAQWSLIQVRPDQLLCRLTQNDAQKTTGFTLLQFDPQDYIQFSLVSGTKPGMWLKKGDVIGELVSSENKLRLSNLRGELEKAESNLNLINTGEKTTVQEESKQALAYAIAQRDGFKPQLERKRQLFRDNLVSQEELELTETTYDLYCRNVSLQEARVKVVESGEKTEWVRLAEADIARLRKQIAGLDDKASLEHIRTPIDGIVADSPKDSILCQVNKIDTAVAQLLIQSEAIGYIKKGQPVRFFCNGREVLFRGTVQEIGNQVRWINSQPMVIATSSLKNQGGQILPGMTGYAKIVCDPLSVFGRLERAWKIYAGNRFVL